MSIKIAIKELLSKNVKSFTEINSLHTDWANRTFGEDRTIKEDLTKLIDEANEAIENPSLGELADIQLCLLSATATAGFTLNDLLEACYIKYGISRERHWERNANGTFSHLEEKEMDNGKAE